MFKRCLLSFGFVVILLVIPFSSSLVYAEGEETPTEATTEEVYEANEDMGDYGLLQPVGDFLEEKKADLSLFADSCHDSIADLKDNLSSYSSVLNVLDKGLPSILNIVIIFALVFAVVRKVIGR